MKISSKKYAQALLESLAEKDKKETDKILNNFIKVLSADNRLSRIEEIVSFFNILWRKKYAEIEAEIISSEKIDSEILSEINDFIKKKAGASHVFLKEKQNKRILGGVILRFGDYSLNLSLRNKVNKLKAALSE